MRWERGEGGGKRNVSRNENGMEELENRSSWNTNCNKNEHSKVTTAVFITLYGHLVS